MRVVAASDWVIDLGPGAGDKGGKIVAAGPPAVVAAAKGSQTAPYLRAYLQRRQRGTGK
jgi:excinuclease ABC subunit A